MAAVSCVLCPASEPGCRGARRSTEAGVEGSRRCSILKLQLRSPSLGITGLWSKFSWAPRERQCLCLARTILT